MSEWSACVAEVRMPGHLCYEYESTYKMLAGSTCTSSPRLAILAVEKGFSVVAAILGRTRAIRVCVSGPVHGGLSEQRSRAAQRSSPGSTLRQGSPQEGSSGA